MLESQTSKTIQAQYRRRTTIRVSVFALVLFVLPPLVFIIAWELSPPYWSVNRIEAFLGVSLPDDAVDIAFSGPDVHLHLTFRSSGASDFVEHICGEVLHQGYDPFNSTETELPTEDSILILGTRQAYYSHSDNTPSSVRGTRCQQQAIFNIRVVEQDDYEVVDLDALRFVNEMNGGDYADFVNPNLEGNLPLLIIGMVEENDIWRQVYPEMCMRISYGYHNGLIGLEHFVDDPTFFLGSEVEILIDEQIQPFASIGDESLRLYDEYNNPIDWYCIPAQLPAGTHTLSINVTRPIGDSYTYSWDFIVE